ncbi:uncharacterized protein LOC130050908 [Ostrea edulis]|uniref:uncharacterized protein LOC130050908 n=1 Tax=Ostrea edulis TaxID=37623 RepID=UPI0024AF6CD3|nr:uncharacterized protein LOC130050908 [Ostrea edulis]
MENQKMISGNVFRSMADDNDLKNDFVPYDQVKDTILKIEVLKTSNANVSSFLPSWADDEYFLQLHKPKKIKKRNLFETSMETGETVLEKVSEDTTTIESGLNAENGQITYSLPDISSEELEIKIEDVAAYILSIVEKACTIVLHDIAAQNLDQDDGSIMEETKNANTSDANQEMENECLPKPVKLPVQELKQKTKPVQSGQDKPGGLTALETGKIQKFIPRKLFLSSIETFKLAPESQDSTKNKEKINPVKPRPLPCSFQSTTGLSPAEEPRVVRPRRRWRDRILRFLGFKR